MTSAKSNTPASILKVLIADDHPALRMGLGMVVNNQADMRVVAEATSGPEAVALCGAQPIDVVLMDLRMPGGNGLEAIAAITSAHPHVRVIVLTTYDLDEDIYRAMRAGAKAFLLKDSPMGEIAEAIRQVHRGEQILPPRIQHRLGRRLRREDLTQREMEILQLIVKGQANKEIAASLFISEATVKTHLKTLFQKLGVNLRTEAAIEAVRSGLVYLE
jgi:two-component system, NarL family, response regulator